MRSEWTLTAAGKPGSTPGMSAASTSPSGVSTRHSPLETSSTVPSNSALSPMKRAAKRVLGRS